MKKDSVLNLSQIFLGLALSLVIFILGAFGVFDPIRSITILFSENLIIYTRITTSNINEYFFVFNNISSVKKENNLLSEQVVELNSQLLEKNQQLENIGFVVENNLIEFGSDREFIASRILYYEQDQSGKAFINKGDNDGVREDDIIVVGNFVVGEIIKTFDYYSEIKIIATSNYRINVVSTPSNTRGILEGTLGSELKVTNISNDANIQVGEVFITEGQDNRYPYGLYVGTVIEIIGSPAEPTKEVLLSNSLKFKNLDRVYVSKYK